MRKFFILLSGLLSLNCLADAVTLTCPAPSQLKKDPKTQVWFFGKTLKNADFKSYDLSFAKQITSFVGAQWQGENVGTITCIYQPADKYTFTVIVSFGHLVKEPTQGLWGSNQGGYRNCVAAAGKPLTLADCAFMPMVKNAPVDIYQQLNNMKGSQ